MSGTPEGSKQHGATGSDLSLSAATRDLKMSTRWSKGTHWGASRRSAASDAGRPPTTAASLQMHEEFFRHLLASQNPTETLITHAQYKVLIAAF